MEKALVDLIMNNLQTIILFVLSVIVILIQKKEISQSQLPWLNGISLSVYELIKTLIGKASDNHVALNSSLKEPVKILDYMNPNEQKKAVVVQCLKESLPEKIIKKLEKKHSSLETVVELVFSGVKAFLNSKVKK